MSPRKSYCPRTFVWLLKGEHVFPTGVKLFLLYAVSPLLDALLDVRVARPSPLVPHRCSHQCPTLHVDVHAHREGRKLHFEGRIQMPVSHKMVINMKIIIVFSIMPIAFIVCFSYSAPGIFLLCTRFHVCEYVISHNIDICRSRV